VANGDLFVALAGARVDGHDYLLQVAKAGAAVAIVERMPSSEVLASCASMSFVEVGNSLLALQLLAKDYAFKLDTTIVGITGTVGKTSAKDCLAFLLGGAVANVHAAPASYNSEIGLPLAVLSAPSTSTTLVLEYGVNEPGEMDVLIDIAAPNHCWLTALSEAHLAGMGDLLTIVKEKSKLCWSADRKVWSTRELAGIAASRGEMWGLGAQLISHKNGDYKILRHTPGDYQIEFDQVGVVEIPFVACHQAEIAAVAVGIALELGVDANSLAERIADIPSPSGRLELQSIQGLTVLNDSYNANPSSMLAALQSLSEMSCRGQRVAILGTMNEMGARSAELHRQLGAKMQGFDLDLLIGIGEGGQQIVAAAKARGGLNVEHFPSAKELDLPTLEKLLGAEDLILIKASRSEQLEQLLITMTKLSGINEFAT